jgi:hypothetical protein
LSCPATTEDDLKCVLDDDGKHEWHKTEVIGEDDGRPVRLTWHEKRPD